MTNLNFLYKYFKYSVLEVHGKNGFAKISKILVRSENNLSNYQNNYMGRSN